MKTKLVWAALGALVAVVISSTVTFFTSYEDNVSKMLPIYVKYKSESFVTDLSSDMCDYITDAKKTTLYFGELPSQEEAIEVNAPGRATIYVYPSDEDSLLIRYEPRGGQSA